MASLSAATSVAVVVNFSVTYSVSLSCLHSVLLDLLQINIATFVPTTSDLIPRISFGLISTIEVAIPFSL